MKRLLPLPALLLAVLLDPAAASACSVCFGEKGSQANLAAGQSILFLLAIIVSVLAAVVAFFVVLARRAARASACGEDVLHLIQTPETRARRL